jgi:hypothetical protein
VQFERRQQIQSSSIHSISGRDLNTMSPFSHSCPFSTPSSCSSPHSGNSLPILRLNVVSKRLRLLVSVVTVSAIAMILMDVVVSVSIILRPNVLHLVNASTLGASLDRTLACHLDQQQTLAIRSAPLILSISLPTYFFPILTSSHPSPRKGATYRQPNNPMAIRRRSRTASILLITARADHDRVVEGAAPRRIQRPHVEDIDALHLTQDLETLQTGRLFEIGRHGP